MLWKNTSCYRFRPGFHCTPVTSQQSHLAYYRIFLQRKLEQKFIIADS